jgi:hypothetical protein
MEKSVSCVSQVTSHFVLTILISSGNGEISGSLTPFSSSEGSIIFVIHHNRYERETHISTCFCTSAFTEHLVFS